MFHRCFSIINNGFVKFKTEVVVVSRSAVDAFTASPGARPRCAWCGQSGARATAPAAAPAGPGSGTGACRVCNHRTHIDTPSQMSDSSLYSPQTFQNIIG